MSGSAFSRPGEALREEVVRCVEAEITLYGGTWEDLARVGWGGMDVQVYIENGKVTRIVLRPFITSKTAQQTGGMDTRHRMR